MGENNWKIFSNRGLLSTICKEVLQLNNKNTNNSIKTQTKALKAWAAFWALQLLPATGWPQAPRCHLPGHLHHLALGCVSGGSHPGLQPSYPGAPGSEDGGNLLWKEACRPRPGREPSKCQEWRLQSGLGFRCPGAPAPGLHRLTWSPGTTLGRDRCAWPDHHAPHTQRGPWCTSEGDRTPGRDQAVQAVCADCTDERKQICQ